jgi:hypothetical protein
MIEASIRIQFIVGGMLVLYGPASAARSKLIPKRSRSEALIPVYLGLVPLLFAVFGWIGGLSDPFLPVTFWLWLGGLVGVIISALAEWSRTLPSSSPPDTSSLHVPKIALSELWSTGSASVWRMKCSCGWKGPLRLKRSKTVDDHSRHVSRLTDRPNQVRS